MCGSTTLPASLHYSSLQPFEIPAPFTGWGRMRRRVASRLLRFYDRQQQRRALMELDDRMLADIGITRQQAQAAARELFWLSALRAFPISN
jgi:uncharacterized protein YjiS (DUF1127 family)